MSGFKERVGNPGYLGLAPEATKGTPVTPTDYVPCYEETLMTDPGLQDQAPIFGSKFEVYKVLPGMKSHTGDVTVMDEANTATKFVDMLLTRGSKTGSGPYTWPFTLSSTTDPKSYTVDISYVDIVVRYWGVEASKMVPSLNNNEWQNKVSVTGLGSFAGREITTTPTGSGTYTITLANGNDTNTTKGLVTGDLIRVFKADGTTIDCTVASVASATTITTTTDVTGAAAGDMLFLRPATVSLNNLPVFLASNTEWRFGDTAADALTATMLPVELSSTWEVDHNMHNAKGESRFGSRDPASIIRTTGNYAVTVNKIFAGDEDIKAMNSLAKKALVIRMFAYDGANTYEKRLTFNNLTTDNPLPQFKPKEVNYSTIKYHGANDEDDGQGMSVTMINDLSSIA